MLINWRYEGEEKAKRTKERLRGGTYGNRPIPHLLVER